MFKEEHPHFVTGNFTPQNVYLGDKEYGMALDCLVKACTDLLILDSDDHSDCKLLLGKRIVEPQPDWWYVGGRMKPGETPEQSISRLVKRELHLLVEPSRFQQLGTHSYVWARRQQPPMDNGTCDISVVLTLVLLPGEADCIYMDEKEYSEFRWFSVSEVIADASFHPALRASARDIWQRQSWRKLVHEVRHGGSTESIAEAAKTLVNIV
jgi:ADP-ribose pyrophosphatase YjhB (NUDIX family)